MPVLRETKGEFQDGVCSGPPHAGFIADSVLWLYFFFFCLSSSFSVQSNRRRQKLKFILRRLTEETSGEYSIAGDENHYRDSLMAQCTPPPTQPGREGSMFADLVRMGFPAETQVRCSDAAVVMGCSDGHGNAARML